MAKDFLILWAVCATAIGGLFGLCMYLGYRAGYAKAISTIKFGIDASAQMRHRDIETLPQLVGENWTLHKFDSASMKQGGPLYCTRCGMDLLSSTGPCNPKTHEST